MVTMAVIETVTWGQAGQGRGGGEGEGANEGDGGCGGGDINSGDVGGTFSPDSTGRMKEHLEQQASRKYLLINHFCYNWNIGKQGTLLFAPV